MSNFKALSGVFVFVLGCYLVLTSQMALFQTPENKHVESEQINKETHAVFVGRINTGWFSQNIRFRGKNSEFLNRLKRVV